MFKKVNSIVYAPFNFLSFSSRILYIFLHIALSRTKGKTMIKIIIFMVRIAKNSSPSINKANSITGAININAKKKSSIAYPLSMYY